MYRCRRAAGGAIDRDRRRLSEFLFSRCKRGRWFAGKPSKVKGSPYSISERRVPKLIPVLGSQSADDMSHKPGGRLPLLSARPAGYPRNP